MIRWKWRGFEVPLLTNLFVMLESTMYVVGMGSPSMARESGRKTGVLFPLDLGNQPAGTWQTLQGSGPCRNPCRHRPLGMIIHSLSGLSGEVGVTPTLFRLLRTCQTSPPWRWSLDKETTWL